MADTCLILGFVLVVAGVAGWSYEAAAIVAGVWLFAAGAAMKRTSGGT